MFFDTIESKELKEKSKNLFKNLSMWKVDQQQELNNTILLEDITLTFLSPFSY